MKKLSLRKGTLLISSQGLFYRVMSFNSIDIVLISLLDGEFLSIRSCLVGNSPTTDEIYELFFFNFRPIVYQVGDKVEIKNSDSTFEVASAELNDDKKLVLYGIVHITKNGGTTFKQLSLTYQQLMNYAT